MRRFPDLSGLVTRGLLTIAIAFLGAAVVWLARASTEAIVAAAATRPSSDTVEESGQVVVIAGQELDANALSSTAQGLWEAYVPAEVRAQYEPPSMERVRALLVRLDEELNGGSGVRLVRYERDARRALKVLRRSEGGEVLAAWLEPRLDLLKAAAQMQASPADSTKPPDSEPSAATPLTSAVVAPEVLRPQYTREYWDRVLGRRRPPRRAAELVPRLKEIFAACGVPPEFVWIAEVESSMNPEAVSPVGARGLFQFMPLTAARFGLEMGVMVDERTDPEKSARAAASYLRVLHRRFQSWPLVLAAYNAGEGRVGRALRSEAATSFETVAHRLPLETRMYVPKVLATVAAREAVDPVGLPPPSAAPASGATLVRDAHPVGVEGAGSSPAGSASSL